MTVIQGVVFVACVLLFRRGEVLQFIRQNRLSGSGIGYVDAYLLVAVKLAAATSLWTRDRRLQAAADRLGLAFEP